MSRRTAPRVLTVVGVVTMVVAVVGFITSLILNAFVFDEYDAYGEVSIPGSTSLQLPAGDATVTFHTLLIGTTTGSGLPVPPLKYRIVAPEGVVQPRLTEDYGTTTTVNNDARIRIGYLHVETGGTYGIETDGNVSAYLNPTLAFGHGSRYGYLPIVFVGIFGIAAAALVLAWFWAARLKKSEPTWSVQPPGSFTPSDAGIRIQSLNTLARLRDSGALTEAAYETEKKRVLDGL